MSQRKSVEQEVLERFGIPASTPEDALRILEDGVRGGWSAQRVQQVLSDLGRSIDDVAPKRAPRSPKSRRRSSR